MGILSRALMLQQGITGQPPIINPAEPKPRRISISRTMRKVIRDLTPRHSTIFFEWILPRSDLAYDADLQLARNEMAFYIGFAGDDYMGDSDKMIARLKEAVANMNECLEVMGCTKIEVTFNEGMVRYWDTCYIDGSFKF